MTAARLTRHFVLLRALRWLPVGLVLPFMVITPEARGLSIGEIGAVFAVHSVVAIALEVPSGALADTVGRRRVMLAGAALTAVSLLRFAFAQTILAFMAAVGLLAAGLARGLVRRLAEAARPVGAADARPIARYRRGGDRDGARRARRRRPGDRRRPRRW